MSLNGPGATALMLAIQSHDRATISALLAFSGIDVNQINKDGGTALMRAVATNDLHAVTALLAVRGIDVNHGGFYYDTALLLAIENDKSIDIIRALLSAPGIDVNKQARSGLTPLISATSNGNIDAVRALLSAPGININLSYRNGKTALTVAFANGYGEIVKLLKEQTIKDLQRRPEPVVFSCKKISEGIKRAPVEPVNQAEELATATSTRRNPKRATAFTGSYKYK
jgi:ankyrin repeat protein